jgi:streptogramin lyase
VAVANRAGSITKIAARVENCDDRNMDDVIQTSSSAQDVLPWWEDECVLWNHDVGFPQGLDSNQGGPRAVAWDGGDPKTPCDPKPNLWIGWRDQPDEVVKVRRLDGATGNMLGEVEVPDWQGNWGHGTYGGAADRDGAFWGLGTLGTVIRVDPKTYAVQRWDNPNQHVVYGIALDADGMVWLAGWDGNVWRFDPATEQFTDFGPTGGPSRLRGLMVDKDGSAWIAGNDPCGLSRFDTVSGQYLAGMIDLPGCAEPVGVSIDYEGYVWVVDRGADRAYKVDPGDYSSVTVEGLVSPYTYSDMTGVALDNIINPPQG